MSLEECNTINSNSVFISIIIHPYYPLTTSLFVNRTQINLLHNKLFISPKLLLNTFSCSQELIFSEKAKKKEED